MTFEELIDKFQNDPSPEGRRQAVDDLIANQMINETSIKAFAQGFMDSDIGIRDICQRALLGAPDELKSLSASVVAHFINMREIELRNLAGEALTKLGKPSVPILLPYLKSNDRDVRKFACDILGLIADDSIAGNVIPLLSDPDRNVQLSAVEALGNLHAEQALDQLIMVYENFDEIKPQVIESIGKIGGHNSESYLLEQLDKETDQFLLTTIIDALAFNAKDIHISYKLLEKMKNSNVEMQKIMLMTSFAISFRLDEQLVMPDELRYVSHLGMKEEDMNIVIASLISLGDSYRSDDVKPLIQVIVKEQPELNKQIMYNLIINSSAEEISYFFEEFFDYQDKNEIQSEFIDNITLFWSEVSEANKAAVIESFLINFEFTGSHKILNLCKALEAHDREFIRKTLTEYANETSEENKRLVEDILASE